MDGSEQVQMRAIARAQTMDGALKPRQVFWTTPARAQHYIDNRIAEYVAPLFAPKEQPMGGPQETKKSLPGMPGSLLTDSAASIESGKDAPLSAAAQAPVTTPSNPRTLTLPSGRGRRRR